MTCYVLCVMQCGKCVYFVCFRSFFEPWVGAGVCAAWVYVLCLLRNVVIKRLRAFRRARLKDDKLLLKYDGS